jgi:ATP/maltotriose-dependent transcriptional regulator MalT/DNA-binding SARP family transcriptional activator
MGPAGSGKTTLATTYIESISLPCIWYHIDAGDNDPATFFYYLGQSVLGHLKKMPMQLPPFTPEYVFGADVFSRRYFEQIGNWLEPPAIFVFDNYQYIASESPLHNLIRTGITHLPSGFRAIVLSRTAPPPAFARMKANCRLGTIVWEDLRLDPNETSEIIDLRAKTPVSKKIKKEIHERTQGWAAGLSLFLQFMTTKQNNFHFPDKTPEEIFDYFAEEVFNSISPETKKFLVKTSFLYDIKVDHALALTGNPNAKNILQNIQRLNFFIEQPDEKGETFRFHPLFREFLQNKSDNLLNHEELLHTKKTAGSLLERSNNIEEAIFLYLSSQDYGSAIRIIMRNALTLIEQGRNNLLLEWLAYLPESLRADAPWLLYWKGVALISFDPLLSVKIFEDAYQLSVKKQDIICKLLSFGGILDAVFYAGEDFTVLDKWLDKLDNLKTEIESCPDIDIQLRVAASVTIALTMRRPQNPIIEVWAERIFYQKISLQNVEIIVNFLCQIAWYYYCYQANLSKAKAVFDKINFLTKENPVSPVQILNRYVVEVTLHAVFGNTYQCSQVLSEALSLSEKSGVHLFDFMLIGHQISNALNQNDLEEAQKLLKILEKWDRPIRFWDESFYHFLKARTALIKEDFNEAAFHAKISMKSEDKIGSPVGKALTRIILAQIFHAQGKVTDASALLEEVLKLSKKHASTTFTFFAYFLKAQFSLTEGDANAAASWLKKLGEQAKNTGFVNTYVDQPSVTAGLCVFAIENKIETKYFNYVVQTRNLVPSKVPIHLENWPWSLKIYTLGQFRIEIKNQTLTFVGKVQEIPLRLLKLIFTLGGTDVPEEQLSDILWPDADGYSAHRAFSTAIYRLRNLLKIKNLLPMAGKKVSLDKRLCWVDSWAFEKITNEVLVFKDSTNFVFDAEKILKKIEKSISLYQGEFLKLEDWGAPILSARERLRSLFIQMIESIGDLLEKTGRWEEAIKLYKRGLSRDGFVEKFYQRLMICYSNIGHEAEACIVFDRCRKMMLSEFGIEPGRKTLEIRSVIKHR